MPGEERYPARHVVTAAAESGTAPLDGVDDRERALAWRLVLVVGLAYVAAQLLLLPIDRPPLWDESVYLSQVTPGSPAIEFLASRARGITILIAPVTWLGGSVTAVRIFLLLASAAATMAAYRVWIPLIGIAAPVGAITYCFSWIGLLNGSEIFPNPWAAILALATAGLVARRVEGGDPRHTVLAAITIGALALIRPTEAVALAAAIGIWVLLFRPTWWRVLAGLGAGLLLGWLPWIVEMSVRFGGPLRAFEAGASAGQVDARTGFVENVLVHLAATDGRRADAGAPVLGVAWWVILGVVAAIAIARASRRVERSVSVLALIGALVLASEYLVLVSGTAPRFMLPTYALASIPAGIAITTLLRGHAFPRVVARVAGVVLLLLLLPWAIWQGTVADRYLSKRMISTIAFEKAGHTLRRLANGRTCAFQTPHGWPTTMFFSGCLGSDLVRPGGPTAAQLDELATDVDRVFVILKRRAPRSSPLRAKTPVVIEGPTVPWYVYEWP